MDIFFADPDDIPLPPEEVKIRQLEARPYHDGQRIAVRFEITPFQKRPNVEVKIKNAAGQQVASLSVVEVMENRMEFTIHLREPNPTGQYTVSMRVFYSNLDSFELGDRESAPAEEILDAVGQAIDTFESTFEVPSKKEE
jgi:hypothetical protein